MKIDRRYIFNKYNGHCGYCGQLIEFKKFQVDHIVPQYNKLPECDNINNLMPTCRKCNHYKRAGTLETFRRLMITLHERIAKIYIVEVGINFGMLEIKPFDGIFYFEKQPWRFIEQTNLL